MLVSEFITNVRNPQCSGLYQITNLVSGKYYIGSSNRIGKRWIVHRSRLNRGLHTNPRLQASWQKHGESVFRFEVLAVLEIGELPIAETQLLSRCIGDPLCFNLGTFAGRAWQGRHFSKEHREKIGAGNRGKVCSAETRERMRTAQLNRPPEVRERYRIAHSTRIRAPITEETRAKMRASAIVRCRREAHEKLQCL